MKNSTKNTVSISFVLTTASFKRGYRISTRLSRKPNAGVLSSILSIFTSARLW